MVEDRSYEADIRQEIDGDYNVQIGRLNITVNLLEVDGCLDEMAGLLKKGETIAAIRLGEVIWRKCEERMTNRQKYRLKANIGHAYDWEGDLAKAAEFFFEAFQYDPDYEKAKARHAIAQIYTGAIQEAHRITTELLKEFPENKLGRAIWVMSAPQDIPFSEVEANVPKHQAKDIEVAMALAKRALAEGQYDAVDRYMGYAEEGGHDNARIYEQLGDWMCHKGHLEELAYGGRGPTDEEINFLNKAVEYYSSSLQEWEQRRHSLGMARLRRKRSTVYRMLGAKTKYEEDITTAYNINHDDPDVSFQYAVLKLDQGMISQGIEVLEALADNEQPPATLLVLAQARWRRNEDEDRSRAIESLKLGMDRLGQTPYGFRIYYIDVSINMIFEGEGIDEAVRLLEERGADCLYEGVLLAIKSSLLRRSERVEEALDAAKQAGEKITEETSIEGKRMIAITLQDVGMHREAFQLWQEIVKADCIGSDTYRMIECGDCCGAVKEVLKLTVGLRENRIWDRAVFEREIYLRQKYNDWRGCEKVLQDFLADPLDDAFIPYARAHLSHVAGILGHIDLIETNPCLLPSPWDVSPGMGHIIVQALRLAGEPENSVIFAYELVRKHWNSPEAHITMCSFMVPVGFNRAKIELPKVVDQGMAVRYREKGRQEAVWHIIEDSEFGVPDEVRREYSVDHIYSQRMLGLKKGDTFLLREGGIQERRATILEILSKCDFRIRDCMENFEDRFPDSNAIIKINAYRENGEIDLEPMRRAAATGEKRGEELLALHQKQPVPIYFMAMTMGKDMPSTLKHLITDQALEVQCRLGNAVELETAAKALEEAEEIIIDEMTLTTLLYCGLDEYLAKIPKRLVVSEGTLLSIENWEIMRADPNNPGGSIGLADGKLTFSSRPYTSVILVVSSLAYS